MTTGIGAAISAVFGATEEFKTMREFLIVTADWAAATVLEESDIPVLFDIVALLAVVAAANGQAIAEVGKNI